MIQQVSGSFGCHQMETLQRLHVQHATRLQQALKYKAQLPADGFAQSPSP